MSMRKLLIPAFLISLIAVFLIFNYVQNMKHQFGVETNKINVLVAKQDIPPGTAITDNLLETKSVSAQFGKLRIVPPAEKNYILNQTVAHAISAGAPILYNDLERDELVQELFSRVEVGQRAITINASESSGVANLLRPGDHVDVIATFDLSAQVKNRGQVTKTILQNVTVLAVGSMLDQSIRSEIPGSIQYNTVTLLVPPEAAELIVFVKEVKRGDITLSLRHRNDANILDFKEVDFTQLFDMNAMEGIQRAQNQMQAKAKNIPVITGN